MNAEESALDIAISAADWPALMAVVQAIAGHAGATAAIEWSVEAVYQGQSAALEIPFDPRRDNVAALARRFDQAHARVRGHAFDRPRQLLRLRGQWVIQRSEERPVGKECVSTRGSRWSPEY